MNWCHHWETSARTGESLFIHLFVRGSGDKLDCTCLHYFELTLGLCCLRGLGFFGFVVCIHVDNFEIKIFLGCLSLNGSE